MLHKQAGQSNKNSKFEKIGIKLYEDLEKHIVKHKNNAGEFSSKKQLQKIKYEIKKMIESNSSKEFIPSYPIILADSWDYKNRLGIKLLDFFELYKEIK